MKLYKILMEQEVDGTPMEVRKITNGHKRMLNALSRMGIDDNSYSDIWREVRDVFQINDTDLATEITYLYHEYSYVFDEDEKDSYGSLPDDALSGLMGMSQYDDEHIALSQFLELPPFLIEESTYQHYSLHQYEDIVNGHTYAVGDESDVEGSMLEWAQDYFDGEGVGEMDRYYLDDYIEVDDISQFVSEEVEHYLSDMTEAVIIDEAGYDKEAMVEQMEVMESRVSDINDEMETLQEEIDEFQEILNELVEEDEDASETEEYKDLSESQAELVVEYDDKDSEKDGLETQIEDLGVEIDDLLVTATDEVTTQKEADLTEQIEDEGVDYFIDNLGYSLEDAIRYFCSFDETGFVESLVADSDHERLATYDGVEDYEHVNGENYYIYRTQ